MRYYLYFLGALAFLFTMMLVFNHISPWLAVISILAAVGVIIAIYSRNNKKPTK